MTTNREVTNETKCDLKKKVIWRKIKLNAYFGLL